MEGIIDSEIAHFHPAEVLVAGCGYVHLLQDVLLPLRQCRRVIFLCCAGFRCGFGCGGLTLRDGSCGDGPDDTQGYRRS